MTRSRAPKTHGRSRLAGACIVALAAFALLPARGAAEPRPVDARIVWARADRAYIAAADSIALAPGDLLTVTKGKKSIASGTVLQVLARDLAAARITSGSLDRAKLDRLRILAERPPLRALPLLRIGYPGRGRTNLLFDCGRSAPHAPFGIGYRADSLTENAYRFTRIPRELYSLPGEGSTNATPWPDTIAVRLFGDAADEEIALERGEIDMAVFWPGEASTRLRADPRWRGHSPRLHGFVAAIVPAGVMISPDHPVLAALNDELFRGDLDPLRSTPSAGDTAPRTLRFVVDPSCPGYAAIQRFLDRATSSAPKSAAAIRLFYSNAPGAPPDSLHATPLFAVHSAIAIEPGIRAYIEALGADEIAGMLACSPAGRAP